MLTFISFSSTVKLNSQEERTSFALITHLLSIWIITSWMNVVEYKIKDISASWKSVSPDCDITHWGWDKMATSWADDICKCNFFNENVSSFDKHSTVPKGPTDNKWSLAQVMAWHRTNLNQWWFSSVRYICSTQPQWVNSLWLSDAEWWHRFGSNLAQFMACSLTALATP